VNPARQPASGQPTASQRRTGAFFAVTCFQPHDIELVERLCGAAFGPKGPNIVGISDAGNGRGAFSVVLRAELAWPPGDQPAAPTGTAGPVPRPDSVVAKLPIAGPNGRAAIAGGAYRREAMAYRHILPDAPIATPAVYAVLDLEGGGSALLLQDLSSHRAVDQLAGLGLDEASSVGERLAGLHRWWRDDRGPRSGTSLRRNTIAGLPGDGLEAGLASLSAVWAEELTERDRANYAALVAARPVLAERFDQATDTLCHGDPRADNLVFDATGRVVLFDWQQTAIQFGEADLAWLAATSITPELRRAGDRQLVEAYGGSVDRYRLGMALPGLAVLFLAQRELTNERTRRLVAVSLQRIAAAVADLDVPALAA